MAMFIAVVAVGAAFIYPPLSLVLGVAAIVAAWREKNG